MDSKVPNINKFQYSQNITLKNITNTPPFVFNYTLHKDFSMKTVTEKTEHSYRRFHNHLQIYPITQ